jgi:hypothetical protein
MSLVSSFKAPSRALDRNAQRVGLRAHFWAGLALLAIGHALIFGRTAGGEHLRPFSDYWFAAVWFGYIFALDALVYRRDGRSLFVSRRPVFLAMLPLSAAMWWGFEALNSIVKNWVYLRPYDIPEWYANLVSCVFFSTVIPAIWESAGWIAGTRMVRNLRRFKGFEPPRAVAMGLIGLGVLSFVLPVLWPQYFFPLIWGFVALILDPWNYLRGRPSMLGHMARGACRVPVAFYLGGLVCGVLWEFWNFWAFPKWQYTVPFVGFWKVFEMPLLGYLGYGPFAWELYALCWFFAGLVPKRARVELQSRFPGRVGEQA